MLKAIIFDAYGTLISTGNNSVKAAERILLLNKRPDISPAEFYGRWKKLHRQHIGNLPSFAAEETIFHLDLCKLYQEYGLARNAHKDVKVMLDTLGHRTAFPEAKELWKIIENFK